MKVPFAKIGLSALLLGGWLASCTQTAPTDGTHSLKTLQEGFQNPTGTARAKVYWWWLNGFTDSTRIVEELRAIKEAGLGGVDIFEIGFRPDGVVPAGPAFMGDSSLNHIVLAINEATRLGLEVGLNLASSWNAGGSWISAEHSSKSLYVAKTRVKGGSNATIQVPFPEVPKVDDKGKARLVEWAADGKPVYRQEIAVLAVPVGGGTFLDTTRIIDVSRYLDATRDELRWQVPAGAWEIQRYVCSSSGEQLKLPSPNSVGPIIDHFDSSATRAHFMHFINRLQPRLGDFRKTALKNFYLASFEATGTIWTPTLEAEFRKINGYDVHKFLPYLFDQTAFEPAVAAQFKRDFDLTISELMINNHYRKGKEIANSYGLNLISESGGPGPPLHNVPVEAIKALGALDVPRGEFWINHARYDNTPDSIDLLMLVKEIAAASHTYQRKITELEAFTSFQNWWEGPGDMKPIGDRAFCEGMNRPVIHGFTHNPPGMGSPGIVYYAGTHYNDKTTWWPKVKPFNDYLARVSYVLQETDFVADVLYYYGEQVPNFGTPKNTRFTAGAGYDYELINTEILLRDLRVKDGLLTLPYGAQFKVLALGEITGKNPALLKKLEELARAGAIITGAKPTALPGTSQALADALWQPGGTFTKEQIKQGKIFSAPVPQILAALGSTPDFDYPDKQSERLDYQRHSQPVLDYIHHRSGALDFYFVRNTRPDWVSRLCSFRQVGKVPQLWDPVTGQILTIPIFQTQGTHTQVPLTLPPYGSYFVVFTNEAQPKVPYSAVAGQPHPPRLRYTPAGVEFLEQGTFALYQNGQARSVQSTPRAQLLEGTWQVSFDPAWGGPETTDFPKLISWTTSADERIRHYSGAATYRQTFSYPVPPAKNERVYLDLGEVEKVAEVWLNDQPLGISWTRPHRFDLTPYLRPGENSLRVEVINTWANRIIGDLTSTQKYTNTNVKERGSRELLWTETPLIRSGLLGPVTLQTIQPVQ
ncbi:hypothetical protein GCM10027275_41960 [Rhabdobacter roseus]|uniref:Beta-mannosidase-like galactose-binding domain-containing protein n=1 Tax=Rhabdobacter roseus TaxID=1655419 RepID=A0A840TS91_9BACT|nr:glycosyl hydrolase [Rhabdobacter roseus]MBB5286174.1 hypothetical protein [Rhabdobacter roseus]